MGDPSDGEPPAADMLDVANLAADAQQGEFRFTAVPLVCRLSVDPTLLPEGTIQRIVEVVCHAKAGGYSASPRVVSWQSLPEDQLDRSRTEHETKPELRVTEEAAIGLMVLLARDVGVGVVTRMAPIGSGADYLIEADGGVLLVEVSGVREDASGSLTTDRLREKRGQLLRANDSGYVAVATFSHKVEQSVLFQMRYVGLGSEDSL